MPACASPEPGSITTASPKLCTAASNAVGERVHRRRVVTHDVERGRRQRVQREPLAGVVRLVAERLADLADQFPGLAEHLLAVVRDVSGWRSHLGGHA